MSVTQKNSIGTNYYIKLALCLLVPLFILLLPCNEIFTSELRKYLAVTLFGISMFIFEVASGPVVALCLASCYAAFGVAPLNVVLSSWSHSIVFQSICCMLILEAVNATPLMKRIAAHLVIRMGGSYFGVLLGISLVSLVAAILIPNSGTTMLIVGLAYGLCLSLNLKPGQRAAAGIMMMAGFGVPEVQSFIYAPQGIGASAAMVSTTVEGFSISYFEIIRDNIIFLPIVIILPFLFSKIYKPEQAINGVDFFKAELEKLGPIEGKEKRCMTILALMIVYLFTNQWHGMDMAYGFAFAVVALLFPAVNVATMADFKRVDLSLPILIACCMSIGNVGTYVGAGDAASSLILPVLQNADSGFLFVATTWLCGVLANLIMTPMALFTLIGPLMGPIAEQLGYSPKIVAYILYHTGNQIVFPYENNIILMMYGFGMMSMGQFCKGAAAKVLIDFVMICALGFPFWLMLGLL